MILYACALYLIWNSVPGFRFWAYLSWEDRGLLLFSGLAAVLFIVWPFVVVRFRHRRIRKIYNGRIPDVHLEFGDSILSYNDHSRAELTYDWIIGTKRYHYFYALVLKDKSCLVIDEQCFTKGDLESLKALLRDKCPGVKIVD